MIDKEFIPYELALELKQLGYPQNDYFAWYAHGGLHYDSEYEESHFTDACCAAPTYSQAFRWFREKYDLNNFIYHYAEDDILHIINFAYNINNNIFESDFKLYEEAELACLKKLIEIVNGKQ
jgi:hypothetical protein